MTYLKWRNGKPYIYESKRNGKKITSRYVRSYADHLRRGGEAFPVTKKMTSTQIKTLLTISRNVGIYQELRRQNQRVAFKPYDSRYYAKWKKEFGL